jgi:chemotaxis response regulator CheB
LELVKIDSPGRDILHNLPDTDNGNTERSGVEARRVLILCEPGLLWRGIQSLLESDPRLTIVGITGDLERARELIAQLKPDVLIVDQAHFPLQLGQCNEQVNFDPPLTLVSLHESDNWIRIHHIEGRALNSPNELIDALIT